MRCCASLLLLFGFGGVETDSFRSPQNLFIVSSYFNRAGGGKRLNREEKKGAKEAESFTDLAGINPLLKPARVG
jgi:hypothetical protein